MVTMDINRLESIAEDVRVILKSNDEWVNRYANYAEKIIKNSEKIALFKKSFREWKPLYLYMTVGHAKDSPYLFSLRCQGQDVAKLNTHTKYDTPMLSVLGDLAKTNEKYFGIGSTLNNVAWRSPDARQFRKLFSTHSKGLTAKSCEHALESIFLSELEKCNAKDKDVLLCGIRPVKIAGVARFQMCTPLSASKSNSIVYATAQGGGIDVLARMGRGGNTRLCVMELKDYYEYPQQAMEQALAYAVFMQELLASESGADWLKIFGFSGNGKKQREIINVCAVMPNGENAPFQPVQIKTEKGILELHYIYLNASWREHLIIDDEKKILNVEKCTLLLKIPFEAHI